MFYIASGFTYIDVTTHLYAKLKADKNIRNFVDLLSFINVNFLFQTY